MSGIPTFSPHELPDGARERRIDVRQFLAEQRLAGTEFRSNSWTRVDRAFSEQCGSRGYIGATWPKANGGQDLSPIEQFVIIEEMLAAGAPVGGHWLADRQSGPQIIRFGSEQAKRQILPEIVAGRCCFAIGMSEPNAGSDLASVRTKATREQGGWRIEGRKIWTTNAHNAQYMTVLCRTEAGAQRHAGLSQMIVALPDPAVSITPILNLADEREFNEVAFDGCFVPDDMVLGEPGQGWTIITSELALERSGPDRFMSTVPLLREAAALTVGEGKETDMQRGLGRAIAHLTTLRGMSMSVGGMIEDGQSPNLQAAVVKDLGAVLEQEIVDIARDIIEEKATTVDIALAAHFARVVLEAPSFSLRGGTREILRGIIGKSLTP
jgi:alkylation response protein AidB-like acyl-CoA dehydrogenase